MKNGRCNLHGGKSPETNQNARKHGLYSSALSSDEADQWQDAPTGNIDDEIKLAKVKHATARRLMQEALQGNGALVTIEKVNSVEGGVQSSSEIKRRPDYEAIADRLLNKIIGLERLKLEQQVRGIGFNDDPEETARRIQQALAVCGRHEDAQGLEDVSERHDELLVETFSS